jgi:hypothetical protein
MAIAPFTYQLPPLASDAEGVEGYLVYTRDDSSEPVGKAIVALEHRGEELLMVERERMPANHERRFLPWSAIDRISVADVALWLNVTSAELDSYPEPDPEKNVENGQAEATRFTELRELVGSTSPERNRAAGTTWGLGVVSLSVLAALTLLLALATYDAGRNAALLALLAIPAVLATASAYALYKARRRLYAAPRSRGQ